MLSVSELIVIGGPSCSGKSYLIDKIQRGERPELCNQLGIDTPSSWYYLQAKFLRTPPKPSINRLVVHYDLYANYSRIYGFRRLVEIISNSDRVTILTLLSPPRILCERNRARISMLEGQADTCADTMDNINKLRETIKRLKKKETTYKNNYSVSLYEQWFKLIKQTKITAHWVLNSGNSNNTIARPYEIDDKNIFNTCKNIVTK